MAIGKYEETNIQNYQSPGTLNMTVNYATLKKRMEELQSFVKEYMIPGEDYGVIEGINRPTLLKPGAEKLCDVYGMAVGSPMIEKIRDETKDPIYIGYQVTVPLVGRADGRVIMHGVGSANSHEKKYKWRWAFENEIPSGVNVQQLKTRIRGKYVQYQIFNDEIDDLDNTLLKMAKKRALVDAVLSATRSSAIFTQDVEDMDIKKGDTTIRDEQRQERGNQNQQAQGTGTGISQAQIRYAHKIRNDKEISDEDFTRIMAELANGKEEIKDLNKKEASEFINFLTSYQE